MLGGREDEVEVVIPVENVESSTTRFRMEPQAQVTALLELERAGLELVGIFHSHPTGPAGPSSTDFAELAYPEAAYLIWSPAQGGWRCRAFRLGKEGAVPLSIVVVDPGTEAGQRGFLE